MASYLELHDVRNHPDLVRKVHVGICSVAYDILVPESGTTTARQDWAKTALKNPAPVTPEIIHYVLVENAGLTSSQIINASDNAVKNAVASAVTKLIGATN